MEANTHWESVYGRQRAGEASWYAPHLQVSLELIEHTAKGLDAAVIDAGGGDSTLVDDLLALGYTDVTVLDVSRKALERAQARLGAVAENVAWIAGDVRTVALAAQRYDVWHDRAVFHFLTDAEDRRTYVRQLLWACRPDAAVVMATFGPEGPARCSGLATCHYSADELAETLGPEFQLVESRTETHRTPSGVDQQFVYCLFRLVR